MIRPILRRSLVSAAVVVGVAVTAVACSEGSEGAGKEVGGGPVEAVEVTRNPPSECPPPVKTPGVVVSYTRPEAAGVGAPDGAGRTPFVRNDGQTDPRVRYSAVSDGLAVHAMDREIAVALPGGGNPYLLRLVPLDVDPGVTLEAGPLAPGRTSWFSAHGRFTDVPGYDEVVYRGLWPGIDLVLRSDGTGVKYEFVVAPGADPGRIAMTYRGADGLTMSESGDLLIETPFGTLRDPRPVSHQESVDGVDVVASAFLLDAGRGTFGVDVGPYDRDRALVIDPGIEYSGLLGGTGTDFVRSTAVDPDGNMYVAGGTMSTDLPVTPGAPGPAYHAEPDAFVAKLDPSGEVVYQTYIGGTRSETALSIAVDGDGNAYVSGGSNSPDFPTTPDAFATHGRNEDVWVVKLDPTGTELVYGTFLPGTAIAGDFGNVVGVDDAGHAYVAGGSGSPDFPTTPDAFGPGHTGDADVLDGFVVKLATDGTGLVWATKIGGSCNDVVNGMRVTPSGTVHVVGSTMSSDFPTTTGAVGPRYGGVEDGFIAQLAEDGSDLVFATMLGGSGVDNARDIELAPDGSRYVTGWTASGDFPTTASAHDTTHNAKKDAFVVKVSERGDRLEWATYLGGDELDEGWGVEVDGRGDVYVAGLTASADFPTVAGAIDDSANGKQDVFVSRFGPRGALLASTYLGGNDFDAPRSIAIDEDSTVYVAGRTSSPDFPIEGATSQLRGDRDGFVTRLRLR